jgi:Na+/phosphate symporter
MSNLAEEMIQLADGAVSVARDSYQINLDYSEESIKRAEEIFNSLHKEVPRNFISKLLKRGLTETQIHSAALMLGAYIGETIRRIHGGEWIKEDVMREKDVTTLKVGETSIFPMAKAYKRIVNGSEDDIWFYYKVITEEMIKTKGE